jgi:4-hydroxy-3-polyprenylbenzoate decarboxylase
MKINAFRSLGEFVSFLEERGQLHRITAPVDPRLEITEINDRVVKSGGPALLFEKVNGSPYPLVANLMGTEQRMSWALGVESLDSQAERIGKFVSSDIPAGWAAKLGRLVDLAKAGRYLPRRSARRPARRSLKGKGSTFGPFLS